MILRHHHCLRRIAVQNVGGSIVASQRAAQSDRPEVPNRSDLHT